MLCFILFFRLSRARRIVENAFGIMASTWRVLLSRIHTLPETTNDIILACCILHNFLRLGSPDDSAEDSSEDTVSAVSVNTTASTACDLRERIADWCVTEGNIDFQYNMI